MRDNGVAIAAVQRRLENEGWSPGQLARRAAVAENTVRRMLDGRAWPVAATLAKIEKALKWPAGRIEALANGAYVATEDDTRGTAVDPDDQPAPEVFRMEGRGWKMTLSVAPDADISPEQLEEAAPGIAQDVLARIKAVRNAAGPN